MIYFYINLYTGQQRRCTFKEQCCEIREDLRSKWDRKIRMTLILFAVCFITIRWQ